jgi:hypothetical protein
MREMCMEGKEISGEKWTEGRRRKVNGSRKIVGGRKELWGNSSRGERVMEKELQKRIRNLRARAVVKVVVCAHFNLMSIDNLQ